MGVLNKRMSDGKRKARDTCPGLTERLLENLPHLGSLE